MRRLLTLALGAGIGYVLGAKAGHERYDQLAELARRMTGQAKEATGMDGSPGGAWSPMEGDGLS